MARRKDHTRDELREMSIDVASRIIEEQGLRKLSIRNIAGAIGYSSGTLYQVFRNLDALIIEVHVRTLDDLYIALAAIKHRSDPGDTLLELAHCYSNFARSNKNRWNALFEHALPLGEDLPEHYDQAVRKLIGLAANILEPLVGEGRTVEAQHEAHVLWASLYGIVSLETSNKLSRFEKPETFVASLVENYITGLRARSQN